MRIFLCWFVGLCAFAGAALAQEQRFELRGFTKLDVRMGVRVQVFIAKSYAVSALAQSGDLDRLVVEQSGETLLISRDTSTPIGQDANEDQFTVQISLPKLSAISGQSGSITTVGPIVTSALSVDLRSGAEFWAPDAIIGRLALSAFSGAYTRFIGACGALSVAAASGALVQTDHLTCAEVQADAQSGATIRAYGTETAILKAISGATLVLSGGADIVSQDASKWSKIRTY